MALREKGLRRGRAIRYNARGFEVKRPLPFSATFEPMRKRMSIRSDLPAIERGAETARPGAALILGGLLLLMTP
jgi:hypothetical protein